MKWEDRGRSRNLEDRRGQAAPRRAGLPIGIGGVVLLFVLSAVTGVDFLSLLGLGGGTGGGTAPGSALPVPVDVADEEEQVRFMSFVLDDLQDFWGRTFRQSDISYPEAKLVLYREAVDSACGYAPSAVGPFYCPGDNRVYLDLSFYDELQQRYGAPGDFAQAYVLAHEIGHHVQNRLGYLAESQRLQQSRPGSANEVSVATELMADCYAGVWAASVDSRGILERGDLEEGLRAAAAVGDDTLARRAGHIPNQETFTHGTAEQRSGWFRKGFDSGDPNACNTFDGL